MKKVLCLIVATGLLAVIGCQQSKPENVAKAYMNQQISAHQGLDLDTSGLKYEVAEETADTAKVLISGDIEVKAELNLVKTGGKWTVSGNAPEAGEPEKPAETSHETSHTKAE
jgi:protein-disulfide isomerase